jgi:hypothetical protein
MVLEDLLKKTKKTIKKVRKELKKPATRKAIGKLAGKAAGDWANRRYESSSQAEKERWEMDRIIHHGDAGYIVREHGKREKSPLLQGIGEGLMVSDSKDRDKCIYPLLEPAKRTGRKCRGR